MDTAYQGGYSVASDECPADRPAQWFMPINAGDDFPVDSEGIALKY